MISQYNSDTETWRNAVDPNLSASEWPPEQLALFSSVVSVMIDNADTIQLLGIRSENPVFEDFAVLASQYRRAYAQSVPTYTPPDNYLASAAAQLVVTNNQACLAAGG